MDRLAEVLELLMTQQRAPAPAPRENYKAPKFSGTGDVDYFISQFEEVSYANRWTADAELIHLRNSLKDLARDCGKAANVAGIFGNLRARFGMTS